jgi:hypothetical protein
VKHFNPSSGRSTVQMFPSRHEHADDVSQAVPPLAPFRSHMFGLPKRPHHRYIAAPLAHTIGSPTMPYGRGGAGNFYAAQQETARAATDLEANAQETQSVETKDQATSASDANSQQQEYAHTGRGGAGNYYSPRALNETGHFTDGTKAPDTGSASMAQGSASTAQTGAESARKVGRGGAGNYAFGIAEDEERIAQRKMEDEKKREQLRWDVEMGVKEQLAEPPRAILAGAENAWRPDQG